MTNSPAWPSWRHYLDDLTELNIERLFDRLDWITGLPHEVFFEVFRREGILDIVVFLKSRSDQEIGNYFRRYVVAPKVHEHVFTDLVYEAITRAFPESSNNLKFLIFSEVRYQLWFKRILNATEALHMLSLQPWLLAELLGIIHKLPTYQEIHHHMSEGQAIVENAKNEHSKFFEK